MSKLSRPTGCIPESNCTGLDPVGSSVPVTLMQYTARLEASLIEIETVSWRKKVATIMHQ